MKLFFSLTHAVAVFAISANRSLAKQNLRARSLRDATNEIDDSNINRELSPLHSANANDITDEIDPFFSVGNMERIVGGNLTDPDEYPYFVMMPFHGCGGTLVAPRIVVTAAHCKPDRYLNNEIYVGSSERFEGERIRVVAVEIHPGFKTITFANHDFAVLLLERPYNMTGSIQMIMNTDDNVPVVETDLHVLGMGHTTINGLLSLDLRDTTVEVISNYECSSTSFIYNYLVSDDMVCAGTGNGKDSCQGDSGGPLVKKGDNDIHYLIGLVSWGVGCGSNPGVYSRISKGVDWIKHVACNEWNAASIEFCGTIPYPYVPPTRSPTAPPTLNPTLAPTTPPPTMSPTHPPSLQPTLPPTLPPTLQPTLPPTLPPTLQPTLPPTLPPASIEAADCQPDDLNFSKGKKKRNCDWVAKKPFGKKGRCKKKHKGKRIQDFCLTTCSNTKCKILPEDTNRI